MQSKVLVYLLLIAQIQQLRASTAIDQAQRLLQVYAKSPSHHSPQQVAHWQIGAILQLIETWSPDSDHLPLHLRFHTSVHAWVHAFVQYTYTCMVCCSIKQMPRQRYIQKATQDCTRLVLRASHTLREHMKWYRKHARLSTRVCSKSSLECSRLSTRVCSRSSLACSRLSTKVCSRSSLVRSILSTRSVEQAVWHVVDCLLGRDWYLCQLAVSDCLSSTAARAKRGSTRAGCSASLYLACKTITIIILIFYRRSS